MALPWISSRTCGAPGQRRRRHLTRFNACQDQLIDGIFATKLHEQDRVGFVTLNSGTIPVEQFSASHHQALENFVQNLHPSGWTPLWERMSQAVSMMLSVNGASSSQWIIALTDGAANGRPPSQVASQLRTQDGLNINVLFITVALAPDYMGIIQDTVVRSGNDHIYPLDGDAATLQRAWIAVGEGLLGVRSNATVVFDAMTTTIAALLQVDIAATITFPIDIADIAEGSAARTAFEADFRAQMAASLGGLPADKVFVDDITAARRRALATQHNRRALQSSGSSAVDFRLVAPASVQTEAAGLVASVDPSSVQVTVGGAAPVAASSITPPVTTTSTPPTPTPTPPSPAGGSNAFAASPAFAMAMANALRVLIAE